MLLSNIKLLIMKIVFLSFTFFLCFVFQKNMAQEIFLGFNQDQCVTSMNYLIEDFYCGSHSWSYKIFNGKEYVYQADCPSGFEKDRIASNLLFVNDSLGFLTETYEGEDDFLSNSYILRTIDYGKTWSLFFELNKIYGNVRKCAFFVLNKNEGICISLTWDNQIFINNIAAPLKDTTFNVEVNIMPICNIDTLSFKIKNENDTINYKFKLNLKPLSIAEPKSNEIEVFPNPAHDYIHLNSKEILTGDCFIRIYNNLGSLVNSYKLSDKDNFYIGDLPSGFYLLEFTNKSYRAICKIIKQ